MNRNLAYGLVAVALLAAAVYFFYQGRQGELPPDNQFVHLHCTNCGADFQLSYRAAHEQTERGDIGTDPETKRIRFRCPHCDQFTGVPTPTGTPSP